MEVVVFFFFVTTATIEPKKKTTIHCHHLLRYNKTKIEEGDGSVVSKVSKVAITSFATTKAKKTGTIVLLSPSFLQQSQKKPKKKATVAATVTFFVAIKPKRERFKGGNLPSSSHSRSHFKLPPRSRFKHS